MKKKIKILIQRNLENKRKNIEKYLIKNYSILMIIIITNFSQWNRGFYLINWENFEWVSVFSFLNEIFPEIASDIHDKFEYTIRMTSQS